MQRLFSLFRSIGRVAPRLILSLLLGTAWPALAQDTPNSAATKVIRIGAGPTGATDFPFGGLIANAISNPPGSRECQRGGNCGVPGLIAVAQTTSNAADNLRALARGDLDLALSQADVTSWAYRGVGAFANEEPMTNLRLVARLYPENVHIVVPANSTIQSVADLKGKRVAIGTDASGTAATAKLILSAYGVKWDTVQLKNIDVIATSDALAKGMIDAAFLVSGAPVLALEDLAGKMPIRLVPISGPTAEKLIQVFPFYSRGVIPPGLYGPSQTAVETIDVGSVLVARANMDPQLGYGIARAIWHDRNAPLFQAGHPRGKLMDKALAAQDIGVPILAGADRYYIESGLMAPPPGATDVVRPAKAEASSLMRTLLSRN